MDKYREVRVIEAHKTLARRSPVLTIIGPARLTLWTIGLIVLGLVARWVWTTGWVSVAAWVIPGAIVVGLVLWAFLWWTGRT